MAFTDIGLSVQVAPFDFLVEDEVLSAEEIAQERREASMWLGDGVYALLPYSSLILEAVPHQGSSWDGTPLMPTSAAAPATVAAARSAARCAFLRCPAHVLKNCAELVSLPVLASSGLLCLLNR